MDKVENLQYPEFWRRMNENSKLVATMPAWVKGSPQNLRTNNKKGED